MSRYSIGEIADFLRLKPHIFRYWEQEIDLLNPTKDDAGRRIYSRHDLQLLYRIKYLVYTRKFTVEGANRRILQELQGDAADAKARVHEARDLLLSVRDRLRNGSPIPRQRAFESVRPDLVEWVKRNLDRRETRRAPRLRGVPVELESLSEVGRKLLSSGAVAAVIRLDALPSSLWQLPYIPITPIRGATLLQLWAEQVRAAAYAHGRSPLLLFAVPEDRADHLRDHLERREYYQLPRRSVEIVSVPLFPALRGSSEIVVDGFGKVLRYPAGLAAVFWALSRGEVSQRLRRDSIASVAFAPAANPLVDLFDPMFLGLTALGSSKACFLTVPYRRGGDRVRVTDVFAVADEVLQGDWERGMSVREDLSDSPADAETRVGRLRLQRSAVSGLVPSSVLDMESEAQLVFEHEPRTVSEASEQLVRSIALLAARLRGEDHGKRGRRRHAEVDWIYASNREEVERRMGQCGCV